MFDGTNVHIVAAFVGGLVAFFAPCVFPLIPAYLSYFGGVAMNAPAEQLARVRWRVFRHSLFFVAGFVLIFVLLGLGASSIGSVFLRHRDLIAQIAGVFFFLFGLFLLGAFRTPWLYREAKFDLHKYFTKSHGVNAFLIGLSFGFAWTPCIGPVLATILFLASQSESMWSGGFLLLVFALGIATPFLILSLAIDHLTNWIRRFQRAAYYVQRVAGALLLLIGFLMVIGQLGVLSDWLLRVTAFNPPL